jgi:hypothetical protein
MHSAAIHTFPRPVHAERTTSDSIESLRNLMYLVRLDAADPASVLSYVDQAEAVLDQMQRMVSGEYPC